MRLIDADALKEAINDNGCRHSHYFDIFDVIDNAPTIEYTFKEAFQKTVCEQRLYCPERPHGKWIDNGSSGYYGTREWYCSSCKFRWIACRRESLDPDWRFCPTCGADMRGDEE